MLHAARLAGLGLLAFFACTNAAAQNAPDTPWDLSMLSQPPQFSWLDEAGPARSMLYAGQPYAGHSTQVFAYYASPRTLAADGPDADEQPPKLEPQAAKYPAVVLVHGGGGTAFREWAELWAGRGYAAIAMDLAGHRPIENANPHSAANRVPLDDGGPGQGDAQKFGSIDQPITEQWPYHAVANVILAHSLIRSFDEVDAQRTAITGISWGGYLTCIVAGVDRRFKAAVPVYGCGYLYENSAWLTQLGRMSAEHRSRWIDLWDPSQYLPHVSMPILFVNGTNDFAYPLDSYMKSFAAVPERVEKHLRITVNMPHGHPPGWAPLEIGWFIDHFLNGGPPLSDVGPPHVRDGRVVVDLSGEPAAQAAELHYTTDSNAINQRTWKSVPARVDADRITADVPPPETTAWFLTVKDARGAIVSTQVIFND